MKNRRLETAAQLLEVLKQPGLKICTCSLKPGAFSMDVFIDHEDTPKTGNIYRLQEIGKGYNMESIERYGWEEKRNSFKKLRIYSAFWIDNKKGLKALKAAALQVRERYLYEAGQYTTQHFISCVFYAQDVFTEAA